jgi:hypothetical protein
LATASPSISTAACRAFDNIGGREFNGTHHTRPEITSPSTLTAAGLDFERAGLMNVVRNVCTLGRTRNGVAEHYKVFSPPISPGSALQHVCRRVPDK